VSATGSDELELCRVNPSHKLRMTTPPDHKVPRATRGYRAIIFVELPLMVSELVRELLSTADLAFTMQRESHKVVACCHHSFTIRPQLHLDSFGSSSHADVVRPLTFR
jgi:hypothetical protein